MTRPRLQTSKRAVLLFALIGLCLAAGAYLLLDALGPPGAGRQFLGAFGATAVLTFAYEWWRRRR